MAAVDRAIGGNFGASIDYAQPVKNYTQKGRRNGGGDHRYEPPRDPFITKNSIYGAPDLEHASTAYVERTTGMRHFVGRMRRLCYAFSRRIEAHRAAWGLAVAHCNFCHVVRTLRVTPAMQAGITDHVWGIEEFYDTIMTTEPVEAPTLKPLAHRMPSTTARELPGGRGFLLVVPTNGAPSAPIPPTTPVAPAQAGQLGLFDPRRSRREQLEVLLRLSAIQVEMVRLADALAGRGAGSSGMPRGARHSAS
ncbi:MAG TPA: hypothetical protein VGL81_35305 [Polyangiaceae bacterium]|jgi:hypothetical protein